MVTADSSWDVCVVGAGPAGLTAGLYTARAGLETLVLSTGESILRRNAHLENVPGFPAGVNPRTFLDLLVDQAERNGCERRDAEVQSISVGDPLSIDTADGSVQASAVICASWADTNYLAEVDGLGLTSRGSKTFVDVTEWGDTGVEGLYAAGRVAGEPHQTVVATGHGAKVALAVIEESDEPFYHDWVAPVGYFTDRGREVPPGCAEIDAAERERRERESMAVMRDAFAEPHPADPTPHPSLRDS